MYTILFYLLGAVALLGTGFFGGCSHEKKETDRVKAEHAAYIRAQEIENDATEKLWLSRANQRAAKTVAVSAAKRQQFSDIRAGAAVAGPSGGTPIPDDVLGVLAAAIYEARRATAEAGTRSAPAADPPATYEATIQGWKLWSVDILAWADEAKRRHDEVRQSYNDLREP